MTRSATIHATVDPETKEKAQNILSQLGMTMSEAITAYFHQIVLHNGLPFELKIPNDLTAKTIDNVEKGINIHEVSSVEELIEDLES